jgi:hypothetical protein
MWKMPKQVYKKDYLDKKIQEREVEWEKNLWKGKFLLKKLKTLIKKRFASKVIMFEKKNWIQKNYPYMLQQAKHGDKATIRF